MLIKSIEYHGDPDHIGTAEISIDGEPLHGVRHFEFDHSIHDCIPECRIVLSASRVDIKQLASLKLAFDVEDVEDTILCIEFYSQIDESVKERVKELVAEW